MNSRTPSQRKGRNICCVVGCTNTYVKFNDLKLYSFPNRPYEIERKQKWIQAVGRINSDGSPWKPTPYSRICNRHFVGGLKSQHPKNPAYNPTIFPDVYHEKPPKISLNRYKRLFSMTASTEKSGFTAQGSVNLSATTLSPQISTQTERSTCLEEKPVENKDVIRPQVQAYFVSSQWTIPKEMDYYRETCDEEYITPDFIEQNTGTKSNEADEELDIKPDIKSLELMIKADITPESTNGEPPLTFLADKAL